MDDCIECTHCRVLMTGWSAPGSSIHYWQCPFCARTHSSAYGEVFRTGAGARRVAPSPGEPGLPARLPQASSAEMSWTLLKARANRWFARLEAEERPAPPARPARVRYEPRAPAPAPAAPATALVRPGHHR